MTKSQKQNNINVQNSMSPIKLTSSIEVYSNENYLEKSQGQ